MAREDAHSVSYFYDGPTTTWDSTPLPLLGYEINDNQVICGYNDVNRSQAYIYDYANAGPLIPIPMPANPPWATFDTIVPHWINNNNVVVGRVWDSNIGGTNSQMAFIWDETNGTRLLSDSAVVDNLPAEWDYDNRLLEAIQILDDGSIVGRTRAGEIYLLLAQAVPPTPKNRGDVTEDLFVGADDLVRILTHWGESGPAVTWGDGDCAPYGDGITTGDQFVGADDYVEVLSMWGTSYPAEPTPTPEPATLGLLLLGGLLAIVRRK